ncbi:MAG: glycosyltransferase family 4 protein, partial [Aquificae bacterium]|nr:glycosyltransferase family 4 protein [Aquificota bacterium]
AMASGKVVISTDAGGIPEYLKDGYNGFLAKVGDWKSLKEKMEKALSLSEEEYRRIGENAVKTARKYSFEETARKWSELIKSLVSEGKNLG